MPMKTARISKGGQISVPAAVRQRWNTAVVEIEDRGDELVLRPAPEDPIGALRGVLADVAGPATDEIRAQLREEDAVLDERRTPR